MRIKMQSKDTLSLDQGYERFITKCIVKNVSERTIEYYQKEYTRFKQFCRGDIKETYSDAELAILLKKPNVNKCTFVEYRTWVYINYLLAAGNRVSTSINVKIKDLDFENQLIRLEKTKNKRQQIIPISNSLKTILLEYLNVRGGNEDDYLFCTETGTQLIAICPENLLSFLHIFYQKCI